MYYQFDTDSIERAQAALVLYALYRSRDNDSPLNGVETWTRFNALCRGACLKSATLPEFIQAFSRRAKINAIKPSYLDTGEPVMMSDTGEMIASEGVHDYRLTILSDDNLLQLIRDETLYLILLVRERIQRERLTAAEVQYED